jgi:hypothetical protein
MVPYENYVPHPQSVRADDGRTPWPPRGVSERRTRWGLVSLLALPVGVVELVFLMVSIWLWPLAIPLVILVLTAGVGSCLAMSGRAHAREVALGLMFAQPGVVLLYSAYFATAWSH